MHRAARSVAPDCHRRDPRRVARSSFGGARRAAREPRVASRERPAADLDRAPARAARRLLPTGSTPGSRRWRRAGWPNVRAATPAGVHLGGYGWLDDLRPDAGAPTSAGYMHAPSLAQAATAAVLRSGAPRAPRRRARGARPRSAFRPRPARARSPRRRRARPTAGGAARLSLRARAPRAQTSRSRGTSFRSAALRRCARAGDETTPAAAWAGGGDRGARRRRRRGAAGSLADRARGAARRAATRRRASRPTAHALGRRARPPRRHLRRGARRDGRRGRAPERARQQRARRRRARGARPPGDPAADGLRPHAAHRQELRAPRARARSATSALPDAVAARSARGAPNRGSTPGSRGRSAIRRRFASARRQPDARARRRS